MDRTAIERIVELGAPNVVAEQGFNYTDKPLSVIKTPCVATLIFHTLKGLVDTLKKEFDNFSAPIIVSVKSEDEVDVHSAICVDDRTRENPYNCRAELVNIPFDRKLDYETMMITLKSKFVETPELLEVVKLLGTITEENSAQVSDDGFSQSVIVRKGIALKEGKVIKPIVRLKPYRTFNEVEQPESEFLLRLSDGGSVALYEADGGAWKLEARKNVAQYLRNELSELIQKNTVIVVE